MHIAQAGLVKHELDIGMVGKNHRTLSLQARFSIYPDAGRHPIADAHTVAVATAHLH